MVFIIYLYSLKNYDYYYSCPHDFVYSFFCFSIQYIIYFTLYFNYFSAAYTGNTFHLFQRGYLWNVYIKHQDYMYCTCTHSLITVFALFISLGSSPRTVLIISDLCKYFTTIVMKDMTAVVPKAPPSAVSMVCTSALCWPSPTRSIYQTGTVG